jgi:putative selenate reductase molybdopterin-binding subunit
MIIQLTVNGDEQALTVQPGELLLHTLRKAGYYGVKHGCETGECGACAVILNGKLVNTCTLLAAQADGGTITTIEGLAPEEPGRRGTVDPIQQAFVELGAIQCGYCTPAQILAARVLLDRTPNPSEAEVREALAGVLCRCTGYVKPVQAVLEAAAILRGERGIELKGGDLAIPGPPGLFPPAGDLPEPDSQAPDFPESPGPTTQVRTRAPTIIVAPPAPKTKVVNQPEPKVDGVKLAKGRPAFTDDLTLPGILYGELLTSPHAHARIRQIDTSEAEALPGVHAVLTYKDVPRVVYASGGQTYPNPFPYDQVSLDNKVRHVGDRVAVVAAETPEIAQEALRLIKVEYDVLPAVFDPEEAMQEGAPVIHDEPDAVGIHDAARNLVHDIHVAHGDLEQGFAQADHIFEHEYRSHQVQQVHIEPHVCITWWDEDDRLVVRSSTQTPFHTRRMLAPLINLPVRRIRVIKPRIGGGFGGKQEMVLEDLCAHLTIATGLPVRMEYSRELSFTTARSRHPHILRYKTGVNKDGTLVAIKLHIVADKGAYGAHGLTVQFVAGFRGLSTYKAPNLQFDCQVVYTNKPAPGAYRGYGAVQAQFALESHIEEIAVALGMDPIEFRRLNWIREGDEITMAKVMGEGREGFQQFVQSSGLEQCVQQGATAINWARRSDPDWRLDPERPHIRRGLGFAVAMHGSGIAGLDMGAAAIKLNDDGSFNLTVGATDLGTGSDTILSQIAAETLGVPLEDIIIYSSDTDFTPFDTGAYASSTTYISGNAVLKAAEQVRQQIIDHAARHLLAEADPGRMYLDDRRVWTHDGRSVTLEEVALHSLHQAEQHQIMGNASHMSYESPPPFAAQYAEVEVDVESGQVEVKRMVFAVDCGTVINPLTASGQVEGGLVQAAGYALCEEMAYDSDGRLLTTDLRNYKIFAADEVPEIGVILVQTYEPSGPYGAKAIAEIPKDALAPALTSAVYHATGVRCRSLPLTPERVWRELGVKGIG